MERLTEGFASPPHPPDVWHYPQVLKKPLVHSSSVMVALPLPLSFFCHFPLERMAYLQFSRWVCNLIHTSLGTTSLLSLVFGDSEVVLSGDMLAITSVNLCLK